MTAIQTMSRDALANIGEIEAAIMGEPQVEVQIDHTLHAGLYSRTAKLEAGTIIAGALIKTPTLIIVSGDCLVHTGDAMIRLTGYHVIEASAGRKQVFVAVEETFITMLFATDATTVEQAEEQFTDDYARLQSRHQKEMTCLES